MKSLSKLRVCHPDIVMTGIPQDFVLFLLFHGKMAQGSIIHHHAFSVVNEEE